MYVSPNVNLALVATAVDMTTMLARLTAARALLLDNIDEAVSLGEPRKLIAGGPGRVVLPAAATMTGVTAGVSGVWSAWAEIIAATATALLIDGVLVALDTVPNNNNYAQFRLGVGAGGAEVVQDTEVMPTNTGSTVQNSPLWVPLRTPLPVPIGARIAVQMITTFGITENRRFALTAVNPANTQKMSA